MEFRRAFRAHHGSSAEASEKILVNEGYEEGWQPHMDVKSRVLAIGNAPLATSERLALAEAL